LAATAELARNEGLWFHVDGAFGALASMVAPELFRGIDLADSLSLCFVNHRTKENDVRAIVSEVEAAASELN